MKDTKSTIVQGLGHCTQYTVLYGEMHRKSKQHTVLSVPSYVEMFLELRRGVTECEVH